jgi:uncharacterized protein DUF6883
MAVNVTPVGGSSVPSQVLRSVLCMVRTPDTPEVSPPAVSEVLPRGAEAFGVHVKLATYSLDTTHEKGGPKARGFEQILGITIDAIDYLEAQILARVLDTPVTKIRDNPPYGIKYTVDMPIRGIGAKADRVVTVRTVWIISTPGDPPRLVSAYPRP